VRKKVKISWMKGVFLLTIGRAISILKNVQTTRDSSFHSDRKILPKILISETAKKKKNLL